MKKIIVLTLHRPNRSPSQRFRFEQYLSFLEANGFLYHFSYLLNSEDDKVFYSKGNYFKKAVIILKAALKRFAELRNIKQYDLAFVHREAFMLGTSFFERSISKRRVKLIFDFDDSIWLQNISDANKSFAWLKNAQKTVEIIKCASLVIAGNQYLANYAKRHNKNVVVIPTTIDTDKYSKVVHKNDKIVIGWSGSITTIQHFEFSLPILQKVKEKFGDKITFKLIGDANYRNELLGINGIAWTEESEIRELSSFDIGIMPLPNNEWASGKCGLKGLQYMALEIPTIMSPVGVNIEIINDGVNGFLAASKEEWIDRISQLIQSEDLRKRLGAAGRKTVIEKYSVIANRNKYLELINSLFE